MLFNYVVVGLLIGKMAATATAQDEGVGTSNPNPQNSSGYWTKQRMKAAPPMYQTPDKGFVVRKLPHTHSSSTATGGAGSEGARSGATVR